MADNSSGMTAIVAIVAIVIILAIGYFVAQRFMTDTPTDEPIIDVTLPTDGETQ